MSLSELERIEAAAKAMYLFDHPDRGRTWDERPELHEDYLGLSRAAAPHLGDAELRKAAKELVDSWQHVGVSVKERNLQAAVYADEIAALATQEPKAEQPFQSAAEYAAYREESGDYRAKQPPAPDPDGDVVERMLDAFMEQFEQPDNGFHAGIVAALRVAHEGYVALEDVIKLLQAYAVEGGELDRKEYPADTCEELIARLGRAGKERQ